MKKAILLLWLCAAPLYAQEIEHEAPDAGHYRDLWEQSPFTRPLNAAESYAVTGVLRIDQRPVVTLLNTATGERFSLSTEANAQGWRLIELRSDPNPRNVMAVVSINGEEVAVRFNDQQLAPEALQKASEAARQRAVPPSPRAPGSRLNPAKSATSSPAKGKEPAKKPKQKQHRK